MYTSPVGYSLHIRLEETIYRSTGKNLMRMFPVVIIHFF